MGRILQLPRIATLRTLIDCDGVLSNFTKMFLEVVQTQFGVEAKPSDGENWDLFDYPEVKAIKNDVWKYILGTKGIIRGLEKFAYADELISRLREEGEVICVTSVTTGGFYADERIMWLIEEMGFERFDIILAYKKYLIDGDVFIDDKPDNVIKWADHWYHAQEGVPVLWLPPGRGFPINDKRVFQTGSIDQLFRHLVYEGKVRL